MVPPLPPYDPRDYLDVDIADTMHRTSSTYTNSSEDTLGSTPPASLAGYALAPYHLDRLYIPLDSSTAMTHGETPRKFVRDTAGKPKHRTPDRLSTPANSQD